MSFRSSITTYSPLIMGGSDSYSVKDVALEDAFMEHVGVVLRQQKDGEKNRYKAIIETQFWFSNLTKEQIENIRLLHELTK